MSTRAARRAVRLAAVAAVAATALAVPTTSADAIATAQHVGVVAGGASACVRAGGSGLDELYAAFPGRVVVGTQPPYAGFVLQINGVGTTHPDNTHYWAYWHDTGSGWVYSSVGGGGYTPAAGTLDGWSYVNGQSQASPPPAASYAAICAGQDPSPTATRSTPSTPTTPRTTGATVVPPAPGSPAGTASAPAGTVSPAGSPSAATSSHHTTTAPAGVVVATTAQTATSPSQASTGSPSGGPSTSAHSASDSAFPPWGTALALVAVAGLAGGAFWRARGRRAP